MIKVLSLVGSSRRYSATEKMFSFDTSAWSFFDAISTNQLSDFDDGVAELRYKRKVSEGEKSCALSHFKIICDDQTNVVLEDDFKFLIDIDLHQVVDQLNMLDYPAVLILGHSKTSGNDFWLQKLKQPLLNREKIAGHIVGENYKINFYGTVAYAYNQQFRKALRKIDKVSWVADDWLTIKYLTGCKIFQLWNKIVVEDIGQMYESSLGNKVHFRHDSRKGFFSNFLKALRAQLIFIFNKEYYNFDLRRKD